MKPGIQKALENIGKEGCYFLCLLRAADVSESEIFGIYEECLEKGFIESDCYVNDPIAVLRLFGISVDRVLKVDANQQIVGNPKLVIVCYENGRHRHFVMKTKVGIWDPLGDSETVKNGHVHSYRVFYGV